MSHIDPNPWERRTLKFRFERDLFVALCGGALFFAYMGKSISLNDLLLSLLITCSLYQFYRWLHIGFNKSLMVYIRQLILPAIICLACLIYLNHLPTSFYYNLGLSLVISYFYNLRIGHFRIRKVPYVKSLLIAFLWVWILVYLPLTFSQISNQELFIVLLENFLFILALTVMYDIYDIEEDEHYGIKTLVNYRLSKHAVRNIVLLLTVSNIPALIFILNTSTSLYFIIPNLIPSIAAIFLLFKYGKESKKGLLLIWDGLILIKALILLLVFNLL